MRDFTSGEKFSRQICENLIKSGKNSGETQEMDKPRPVMKARWRCDHYPCILIHLPPNIKHLAVYEVKGQ